jgi:hypothetical protein
MILPRLPEVSPFLFLICLLATGCGGQPATPAVSAPTIAMPTSILETPVAASTPTVSSSIFESPISPLPVSQPTAAEATPQRPAEPLASPAPTSLPTMGTVRGIVLYQATNAPAPDQTLYLARLIKSTTGGELELAALDPAVAPRAVSDGQGSFIFTDVPPDTYALGLATALGPVLIQTGGKEMVFAVEAGKTIELGSVHIRLDS